MKFRTILKWTLGAHLFALAIAYFIQPKPSIPPPRPMRSVTVQLKPPPAKKSAAQPARKTPVRKKRAKKKISAKKKAQPKKKAAHSKHPAKKPGVKSAPPAPVPVDYQHLLIRSLKEQLELPEIGAVEIRISFGKNGQIDKVDLLSSQSAANSRYLISAIKKIELPPLPRNLRGKCEPLIIEFSSAGS